MEWLKNLKVGRLPLIIAFIIVCWITKAASNMGAHGIRANTLDVVFCIFVLIAWLVVLYGRCNDFGASSSKKILLLIASFFPFLNFIVFIYCLAKSPVKNEPTNIID